MNRLAMVQFSNVLLAIDKLYTVPQSALDCGAGVGWLNQTSNYICCLVNIFSFHELVIFLHNTNN